MTALLDAGRQRRPDQRLARHAGDPRPLDRRAARACSRGRRDAAAVLLDLQGPRIRVGDLPGAAPPRAGPAGRLRARSRRRAGEIPTTYDALAQRRPGRRPDPARRRPAVARGHRASRRARVRRGRALRRRAQGAQGHESARDRGERAGAHREGPRGRRAGGGARRGLHRAFVRPPAGGHGAAPRPGARRASSWSPRSRRTPRSRTSAASSTRRTRSWWPGAIWASSCRSRKCR